MVFILGASLLTSPTFESLPACICVVQQSLSVFVLLSCHKKKVWISPKEMTHCWIENTWFLQDHPQGRRVLVMGIARPTVVFTYLSQSLDNHWKHYKIDFGNYFLCDLDHILLSVMRLRAIFCSFIVFKVLCVLTSASLLVLYSQVLWAVSTEGLGLFVLTFLYTVSCTTVFRNCFTYTH